MYMHAYAYIMLSCTGARPRPLLSMCTLELVHVHVHIHVCLCLHYAVMHRSLPSMTMKLRKRQCRSWHQTGREKDLRYDPICCTLSLCSVRYVTLTACILCTSILGIFIYDIACIFCSVQWSDDGNPFRPVSIILYY